MFRNRLNRVEVVLFGGLVFGLSAALLIAFLPVDYRGPFTWALGFGLGVAMLLIYAIFWWLPFRWRGWQSGAVLGGLAMACVGLTLITSYGRPAWIEDLCTAGSRCQSIISAFTALFIVLTATFGIAAPLAERDVLPSNRRKIWWAIGTSALVVVATFIAGLS